LTAYHVYDYCANSTHSNFWVSCACNITIRNTHNLECRILRVIFGKMYGDSAVTVRSAAGRGQECGDEGDV